MAIKKSVELANGIVAEYWRIVKISILNGTQRAVIDMELWKDASVRGLEGKSPVKSACEAVELDSLKCDLFPTCYSKIKLLENFTGAEDV